MLAEASASSARPLKAFVAAPTASSLSQSRPPRVSCSSRPSSSARTRRHTPAASHSQRCVGKEVYARPAAEHQGASQALPARRLRYEEGLISGIEVIKFARDLSDADLASFLMARLSCRALLYCKTWAEYRAVHDANPDLHACSYKGVGTYLIVERERRGAGRVRRSDMGRGHVEEALRPQAALQEPPRGRGVGIGARDLEAPIRAAKAVS